MSDMDRNKRLAVVLADAPHPARFGAENRFRAAQVRWLLDLADLIDALGLADTDELAGAARSAAFAAVRDLMNVTANPANRV